MDRYAICFKDTFLLTFMADKKNINRENVCISECFLLLYKYLKNWAFFLLSSFESHFGLNVKYVNFLEVVKFGFSLYLTAMWQPIQTN